MKSLYRVLTVLIITSSFLLHAESPEIFKRLKVESGTLKVIQKTSPVCSDGPLKLVGISGEESLMVGPQISFPLPGQEQNESGEEGCNEKATSEYLSNGIRLITRISSCASEMKKLESVVEETLISKDKRLYYERKSDNKKINCEFSWSKFHEKN